MRRTICAIFAAAAMLAFADNFTGTDSLVIGDMAGIDGFGNRVVVVGVAASSFSQSCESNVFVGAASGLAARWARECNGIGHYAFRVCTNDIGCVGIGEHAFANTKNMKNCVGIGKGAFSNTNGLSDAVWINGQVEVNTNGFLIKPRTIISGWIPASGRTERWEYDRYLWCERVGDSGVFNFGFNCGSPSSTQDETRGCVTVDRGDMDVDGKVRAKEIELSEAPYLKMENGALHVFQGNTDLGTVTITPPAQ